MYTEQQARGLCILPEHKHPETFYFDPEKQYGMPWPEWLHDEYGGRMGCMWEVAMAEFSERRPALRVREQAGELAYVYGNGYVLTYDRGVVWHAEISES